MYAVMNDGIVCISRYVKYTGGGMQFREVLGERPATDAGHHHIGDQQVNRL